MVLRVDIQALRNDAATWSGGGDSLAESMAAAATAAETQLRVAAEQFSFVSRETGQADTYEELRAKAARLMGEAVSTFETVAEALVRAADEYERTDDESDRSIREIWRPKDDD